MADMKREDQILLAANQEELNRLAREIAVLTRQWDRLQDERRRLLRLAQADHTREE
jgi:hypothetical protein